MPSACAQPRRDHPDSSRPTPRRRERCSSRLAFGSSAASSPRYCTRAHGVRTSLARSSARRNGWPRAGPSSSSLPHPSPRPVTRERLSSRTARGESSSRASTASRRSPTRAALASRCIRTGEPRSSDLSTSSGSSKPPRTRSASTRATSRSVERIRSRSRALFRPLGEGAARIQDVLEHLRGAGYAGWYVLEQDVMLDREPAVSPPEWIVRSAAYARKHG